MDTPPTQEYLAMEMRNLREELRALKQCQMVFLGLAPTVTTAILGLKRGMGNDPCSALVYLAPLIVIFPTFSFFFDKAKTITRIVGYYRILEQIALGNAIPRYFPGWENALAKFREVEPNAKLEIISQIENTLPERPEVARRVFRYEPPYVYWSLAYITFLIVAILCPVLALLVGSGSVGKILSIPLLLWVLYRFYLKLETVLSLKEGRDSYNVNYKVWRRIIIEGI